MFIFIFIFFKSLCSQANWCNMTFTAGNLFPSHSCIGWPESSPHRDLNPGPQNERQTAYQLSYPSPLMFITVCNQIIFLFQLIMYIFTWYGINIFPGLMCEKNGNFVRKIRNKSFWMFMFICYCLSLQIQTKINGVTPHIFYDL